MVRRLSANIYATQVPERYGDQSHRQTMGVQSQRIRQDPPGPEAGRPNRQKAKRVLRSLQSFALRLG